MYLGLYKLNLDLVLKETKRNITQIDFHQYLMIRLAGVSILLHMNGYMYNIYNISFPF